MDYAAKDSTIPAQNQRLAWENAMIAGKCCGLRVFLVIAAFAGRDDA